MPSMRLTELCKMITSHGFPATLEGDDREITAVSTLEAAQPGQLTFLSNPKYARQLKSTRASAVVAASGVEVSNGLAVVRCEDPYAGVTVAIIAIHGHRRHPRWDAADPTGIDPSACIGRNANIGRHVTVAADAAIGDNATIYPGCYIGPGVRIGHDVTLYPNVVIYDGCELGNRVVVHAGSVIGQDGLGYAPVGEKWFKIPQVGRVVIGDDVEIGACCTIDRATLGETVIGSGTKFSNLVAIGHGSKIGENCMLVAQVGVAGSVTVGRHVTLAGQAGLAGHQTIGDGARIAAQSGVVGDVSAGATMLGSPAVEAGDAKRQYAAIKKLPGWSREVNRKLEAIEDQLKRTTSGK